ncbi:hypothetical protein BkAM31D_22775 [Halalkalibacter krulwichiae]|uniref:Uncharacterized protein n=1 Tax=Halalkalibacter krulwichiae TaxID=199441 RepID=A0A1X9MG71_9BACI|nr:hypothetical protein BkAM31D_22775 [Halalkalibacter krulwichiae]
MESSILLLQPTSKPLKTLSTSNSHLVISIQSTKQIRNRYSLHNHFKPSFFLLYIPFNQSINLTKNASNPYPTRLPASYLITILSSLTPFNIFPCFWLPKTPSNQRFLNLKYLILAPFYLYILTKWYYVI